MAPDQLRSEVWAVTAWLAAAGEPTTWSSRRDEADEPEEPTTGTSSNDEADEAENQPPDESNDEADEPENQPPENRVEIQTADESDDKTAQPKPRKRKSKRRKRKGKRKDSHSILISASISASAALLGAAIGGFFSYTATHSQNTAQTDAAQISRRQAAYADYLDAGIRFVR